MSTNMLRSSFLSIYKVCNSPIWIFVLSLYFICAAYLFLDSLGEAESGLERLHQCAEKEFEGYLHSEGPSKEFNEFRTKLAGLTR